MKHYDDRKWYFNFPLGALLVILMQLLFYLQMFSLLPKFVYIACDLFDVNEAEFDLALNFVLMLSLFAPIIVSIAVESKGVGKYKMACILGLLYYLGVTFILIVLIIEEYKHFDETSIISFLSIGMTVTMMTSMAYAKVMNTLGAEQLKMPDEKNVLVVYFRVLYASRNVAVMISIILGENPNVSLMQIMGMIYSLMTITLLILVTSKKVLIKRINDGNYLLILFEELIEFITTCKVKRYEGVDYNKRASLAENEMEGQVLQRYREEKRIKSFVRLLLPLFVYLLLNCAYRFVVNRQGDTMIRLLSESHNIYFGRHTMSIIEPALKLSISYLNHFILYPFFEQHGVNSGLRRIMLGLYVQSIAFFVALMLQLVIIYTTTYKISILYQIPQYIIFAWSDSLVYVGGMTHSYVQAPITLRTFSITLYAVLTPLSKSVVDYFQYLEDRFIYIYDETVPFAMLWFISSWNIYFMHVTLKNYTFEVFNDVEYTNY